jgi:DNA-binding NarL/FixJ family response regulator
VSLALTTPQVSSWVGTSTWIARISGGSLACMPRVHLGAWGRAARALVHAVRQPRAEIAAVGHRDVRQRHGPRSLVHETVPCENDLTSSQIRSVHGRYQRRNLSSAVSCLIASSLSDRLETAAFHAEARVPDLVHGLNDRDIAEQLIVSPHTVHRHVANIRHKLGCGSRTAAVAEAARLGLL